MEDNRKITLSIAKSRHSTKLKVVKYSWDELVELLTTPIRTEETYEFYLNMNKEAKNKVKDVGGFVAGTSVGGKRKNDIISRSMLTYDLDNLNYDMLDRLEDALTKSGIKHILYSTRSFTFDNPRIRLCIPLGEDIPADQYEAVSRMFVKKFEEDYLEDFYQMMDNTTFQQARLMYFCSTSVDGTAYLTSMDGDYAYPDIILDNYNDWRDASSYPYITDVEAQSFERAKKQEDPESKNGVIGAFCRAYNIHDAIAEFLPEVYKLEENGRYTYVPSQTVCGGVVYEDGKFLYSNHATDPAWGVLCNSYDLVRIHKFCKNEDTTKGMKQMKEFALTLEEVKKELELQRDEELLERVNKGLDEYDFEYEELEKEEKEEDEQSVSNDYTSWTTDLIRDQKTGKVLADPKNLMLIFNNDKHLAGRFYNDGTSGLNMVCKRLPWMKKDVKVDRTWEDSDDSGLRMYLENVYGIYSPRKTQDAFNVYVSQHIKNRLQDYLKGLKWDGVKRVDTLLIDYFNADDTDYTRMAVRKTLLGAVYRALNPGCKFDEMLILIGYQGVGKSTFFDVLGGEWFSDSLYSFRGKDAAEQIQGKWIIESPELATMRKAETNEVKSFLAKRDDTYRAAFAKCAITRPRCCILVGTSNDDEILKDKTGNRRFYPVSLKLKRHEKAKKNVFTDLKEERDMIWAEMVEAYNNKEPLVMPKNAVKQAQEAQDEHTEVDFKDDMILSFVNQKVPKDFYERSLAERKLFWQMKDNNEIAKSENDLPENLVERDKICAAEIWCELFDNKVSAIKVYDIRQINSVLNRLEWKKCRAYFGKAYGERQRGYVKNETE